MKINKVIFSTSEHFSVFWNLNSKIYKTKLNIDPICLLFGKKSNTNMSEEYGKVIEMPFIENIPNLIQITWSKFYHVMSEPETTWLIGDIDLMPLQKDWFISNIENVPNDNYVHLDADGITQLSGSPYTWTGRGEINKSKLPTNIGHESNLPGHYHVAKGSTFSKLRDNYMSFEEELNYIVNSGKYNGERGYRESDPIKQQNMWCAEEKRSSEMVRNAISNEKIKFTGFSLKHGIGRDNGDRIDRSTLRDEEFGEIKGIDYAYNIEKLKNNRYVDLHCARPFYTYIKQTENILLLAGML